MHNASMMAPSRVCFLLQGHSFLWSHQHQWRIYSVKHRWVDGILACCLHPTISHTIFLSNEQWVACFPHKSKKGLELSSFWQKEIGPLWETMTLRVLVQGDSMEPTIPYGASVEVLPWDESMLSVGQIVIWGNPGYWNTHRVRDIRRFANGDVLITRGDALKRDDLPLSPTQILGFVSKVHHLGRSWNPIDLRSQIRARRRWLLASARSAIRMFLHH